MNLNERGSTLPIALLVILALSVLGLALMGNVVGENKRVNTTEVNVQDRYLTENGLIYFENDFKTTINKTNLNLISADVVTDFLKTNLLNQYLAPKDLQGYLAARGLTQYSKIIKDSNGKIETLIMAELVSGDNSTCDTIKVTCVANPDSEGKGKTLVGYYKPSSILDTDSIPLQIEKFDKSKTLPVDFNESVVGVGVLGLIKDLKLLEFPSNEEKFYPIPTSGGIHLDVNLGILNLNLGVANDFTYLKNKGVVAVRKGTLLSAALLDVNDKSVLTVDVNSYQDDGPTNVLINGIIRSDYTNIEFLKLGVTGSAIIQQAKYDRDSFRVFSFDQGLLVKKSLLIGGNAEKVSTLNLQGNIFTKGDIEISNVNLVMGDPSKNDTIYVHGNAVINNACINNIRIFAKGTITINNNSSCSNYNGIFYAQNGIIIDTNNKQMTINGGLIGNVSIKGTPDQVTVNQQGLENIKLIGISLTPKGRKFEN